MSSLAAFSAYRSPSHMYTRILCILPIRHTPRTRIQPTPRIPCIPMRLTRASRSALVQYGEAATGGTAAAISAAGTEAGATPGGDTVAEGIVVGGIDDDERTPTAADVISR